MLTFHPIANVFPLLEGPEFEALVESIGTTGLLAPVWLYDGMILDGRNRYRACQQLGISCATKEYEGTDPVGLVVSLNLTRRHLDESQRAMVAARLAIIRHGGDRRSADFKPSIEALNQEEAATLLNVSTVSVQRAARIQHEGIPELTQAVDTGEIAVSAALPLTALTKEDQPAALTEARTQAKGGKVTAKITKAIVTRETVLRTVQEALEEGASSGEAIKQALATHDIALPTPGLADALARAVPDTVSIPATDGYYHDGRTKQEEADRKAYVQRLFQLINALEALATLPDPAEMLEDIPDYMAGHVHQHLDAAQSWLTTFVAFWRDANAQPVPSLT